MTKPTIKEWLDKAKKRVDTLDAELILLKVLETDKCSNAQDKPYLSEPVKINDRSQLITHENTDLTDEQLEKANEFLARRQNDEPLAYILGAKEFYGREFAVDKDVLIPRPETEMIIDYVLGKCTDDKERVAGGNNSSAVSNLCENRPTWQIFDIGTGSGCIAITLALELDKIGVDADIIASDISDKALKKAEENSKNLHIDNRVKFLKSDLLSGLSIDVNKPTFITANLPYVSKNWSWIDKKQLGFEPKEALYADQDGLALIFELIKQFAEKFKNDSEAILVLESDNSQQKAITEYAEKFDLSTEKISDFVLALNSRRCRL